LTLSAIALSVDPDPIAIARALGSRPGLALLHAAVPVFGERRSFVMADPVETTEGLLPPALPALGIDRMDSRATVPRYVGVIPYECARSVERPGWTRLPDERPRPHHCQPRWNRYAAVVEIDHERGQVRVVGDDKASVEKLARVLGGRRSAIRAAGAPAKLTRLPDDEPPEAHVARINRAKKLIAAGDLYQVNLARRLRYSAEGAAIEHYARLAAAAPAPFGACLVLGRAAVCATSPELFLDVDVHGNVRTAPIKGTRPRGRDAADDTRLVRELEQSPKERAELTMIVDVERNDLGRVAATGSVRCLGPERVDTFRTLHHRFAVIAARLGPGAGAMDLVKAAFPSGSVTGAPKVRAMEVIAQLEPVRRGLYTGAMGAVAFDGSLRLAMAIRVVTVLGAEAHYFTGGGIVADSDPEQELAETEWKATQLERRAEH
jgi:anthranilate/para-aminobenzoate synthase component I